MSLSKNATKIQGINKTKEEWKEEQQRRAPRRHVTTSGVSLSNGTQCNQLEAQLSTQVPSARYEVQRF